jgi:hypothetical protein
MTNGGSNNLVIFSPDSDPYGTSYPEWTAKWWKWVLSIPVENNPANDNTGKNCAINQSGPVWFLAGTVGGVAKRNCTIPAGRAILFPILNHGGTLADEPNIKSEKELLSLAKREMDVISNLEVTVDDVKLNGLERYRIQSPIFDVVLPENNLFSGTPGPTRGAADGYWLFLGPLPKGKHKIYSFGSCLAGKINIGVNYDITIIDNIQKEFLQVDIDNL